LRGGCAIPRAQERRGAAEEDDDGGEGARELARAATATREAQDREAALRPRGPHGRPLEMREGIRALK